MSARCLRMHRGNEQLGKSTDGTMAVVTREETMQLTAEYQNRNEYAADALIHAF